MFACDCIWLHQSLVGVFFSSLGQRILPFWHQEGKPCPKIAPAHSTLHLTCSLQSPFGSLVLLLVFLGCPTMAQCPWRGFWADFLGKPTLVIPMNLALWYFLIHIGGNPAHITSCVYRVSLRDNSVYCSLKEESCGKCTPARVCILGRQRRGFRCERVNV